MKANDIRTGMAIRMDGRILVVVKQDHVKPGKGPAYVQVKLKDIAGGGHVEKRLSTDETIDAATLDRRDMEYLYSDGSGATFMDLENYDQVIISDEMLGDDILYLRPNTQCTVLFHDSKPITIELPASVDLLVTDTPPGIKGATATNQLKEATCETGLKTKVPPFITNGETIRVSTTDGSYLSRAKSDD